MLSLAVFEILTFKNVDVENVGQVQWVQHTHWCYSMAVINVDNSHNPHVGLALTVFEILTFHKFDLRKFAVVPFDGEYQPH